MPEQRLEQLRLLVRVLFAAAAAVLVVSIFGSIQVGTSDTQIPLFGEFQRENCGLIALGVLGGGVVGAGILVGLAGILSALLDREERR